MRLDGSIYERCLSENAAYVAHGEPRLVRRAVAARTRLDQLLVARGLCASRNQAQALIMAGNVRVADRVADKAGMMVPNDAQVHLKEAPHVYASRGGLKLEAALAAFVSRQPALVVKGAVAMDVGASTGGFTDCLLRFGAARVHAVDVGYGQLVWRLREDPRVHVHDRQNIRHLSPQTIGESITLVTVDCSFISLAKVVPHLPPFMAPGAQVVALVKPQFELDPNHIGKGGIVRDPALHEEALRRASQAAQSCGFTVRETLPSPITGREGNHEFLMWLAM